MQEDQLPEELDRLRDLLLAQAGFDEEHWVGVALTSPTVCAQNYARESLLSAQRIAEENGLTRAAQWIGAIMAFADDGRRYEFRPATPPAHEAPADAAKSREATPIRPAPHSS